MTQGQGKIVCMTGKDNLRVWSGSVFNVITGSIRPMMAWMTSLNRRIPWRWFSPAQPTPAMAVQLLGGYGYPDWYGGPTR